jgi:hypothetical protein
MFPTRMMKNTTAWTRCVRFSLALSNGRISNIAAPVVPITLARRAPSARMPVLRPGEPTSVPRKAMPPAIVYSAKRTTRNGTYSRSNACTTWSAVSPAPYATVSGTSSPSVQHAAILP